MIKQLITILRSAKQNVGAVENRKFNSISWANWLVDQVEDSIVQLDIQIRISLPICLDFNQSIFQDLLSIIVVKCLSPKIHDTQQ